MRRVVLWVVLCALVTALCCGCAGGGGDDGRAPGAPTGVTAQAGSATSVHVMWNAVAADPAVGVYEVYRGTEKVQEVPGSTHMLDVVRLSPSTTYVFTVRARDGDGRLGPRSREARATTPAAAAADRSPPTRPGAVTGRAAGSRAVQLSWTASTDDRKVVSYDVYQGGVRIHSVGGGQTATVVTGLRPGARYSFTVRARDAADNVSPAGAPVRLTTAPGDDEGADTAPADFRAGAHLADGSYYLDLSWTPPRVDGVVTEYQIQLDGRPATSLVWGGTPPPGRATYSFYVGREEGTGHRVRLRARLPDGTWGAFSVERTVTTGARR
ncbi:fibronectin type III domain-containing protein [Streptomyces sp. NPDC002740]